jgi:predicted SAM-dependent methyltransferase
MKSLRLYLGCGLVHRPNWINVDRYTADAADVLADVLCLPFPDGVVEAVEADQLIEHLGYVGTAYALYEWARVLAPAGTLVVETPDREATLRAALAEETSAAARPWLLGAEQQGMGHRYLFAAGELADLAAQAGFVEVEVTPVSWSPAHPTLRLAARRGAETAAGRFLGRLHRAVVSSGLVDPLDAPPYLEAVETVGAQLAPLVETPGPTALAQLVGVAARYSPRLAAAVLDALPDPAAWPAVELAQARRLLAELERTHFPARLACRWRTRAPRTRAPRTRSKAPGTSRLAWTLLEREASLYLAAGLYPGQGLDAAREGLDAATVELLPEDREIWFFCHEALAELARRLTARGVRAWSHGDADGAWRVLVLALDYHPDGLWPRWNLARLGLAQGRPLEALEHYEALQAVLPAGLRPALEREVDAVAGRSGDPTVYAVPLSDPVELLGRGTCC